MRMRNKKGQFLKGHKINVGRFSSKEKREKISLANKGNISPRKGIKLSKKIKDKIRQGHLKRGLSFIKNCESCRKEFRVYLSRKDARFCSNKCRSKIIMPPRPDRTGCTPWNKGLTKEDDERIRVMGLSRKGESNPNWNNGSSSFKDKHKKEWKEWREKVFKRDNYICQKCGKKGGELHPDHIKCFAHHPKLRFKISNGRTLCKKCHKKTLTYGNHKCF